MKRLFIFIGVICFSLGTTNIHAQAFTQPEAEPHIQKKAQEETVELSQSLGLTAKQARLVEKKLTEFYMKKHEVANSELPKKAKTDKIKDLMQNRVLEMREILTQVQYDMYVKIR